MLFHFDSTLKNFDPNCMKQGRALEILLGSFQANQHVIFIDMEDLRILKECAKDVISNSSKVALQSIMNRAVEYRSLLDIIDYKIVVYIEDENRTGIIRKSNTWLIPLQHFSGSGLIQSAVLGENDLDSELFLHFAKIFQHKEQLNSFILAGRPKTGGGSGTPKALTSYLRHEYSPCVCITDSDKLHPGYKQSPTSRNCSRAAQIKNRVVEYISLEEREIENLVPLELLKKVIPMDEFLREFESYVLDGGDFWKYIDIKEGINLKWIKRKDEVTQVYWRKALSSLSKRVKNCGLCNDCEDNDQRQGLCHCSTITGLGEKVLEKVVNYMEQNPVKLTNRLLKSDSRWEKIGKIVFDFTIAPRGEMLL